MPSITSSVHTCLYLGLIGTYSAFGMASKDPNMCKQVSAGKTIHVTLIILQELYVIGRLNSGKS
jgi:hypothetical protein